MDFQSKCMPVFTLPINLAGFPSRIKLSTKRNQKAVINVFKNSMILKILKRVKQFWKHWALKFSEFTEMLYPKDQRQKKDIFKHTDAMLLGDSNLCPHFLWSVPTTNPVFCFFLNVFKHSWAHLLLTTNYLTHSLFGHFFCITFWCSL